MKISVNLIVCLLDKKDELNFKENYEKSALDIYNHYIKTENNWEKTENIFDGNEELIWRKE